MPNPKTLRVGDRIRLLRVPERDLKRREQELTGPPEMRFGTADTIERIIATNPIVRVFDIDEYGTPWYEADVAGDDGEIEFHSLAIYDDDTWEVVHET